MGARNGARQLGARIGEIALCACYVIAGFLDRLALCVDLRLQLFEARILAVPARCSRGRGRL